MTLPGPALLCCLLGLGLLSTTAMLAREHGGSGREIFVSTSAPKYDVAPAAAVVRAGPRGRASDIDEAWATATATAAGIPLPAARAYGRAILLIDAEQPSCGLGWTTLAGIGYVESVHGTIAGRSLLDNGHSSTRILGPALDGKGDVAAIPATPDSVAWHGDPRWDHAVGPLQFIPSTWERWASDGDGDGASDPNDVDDAAYAAARYLCADGNDLSSGTGWGAAVFSYNHAQVYVDAVYAAASAYANRTS